VSQARSGVLVGWRRGAASGSGCLFNARAREAKLAAVDIKVVEHKGVPVLPSTAPRLPLSDLPGACTSCRSSMEGCVGGDTLGSVHRGDVASRVETTFPGLGFSLSG
jgi:hypothetical protein